MSAIAALTALAQTVAAVEERLKIQEAKTAALEAKIEQHDKQLKPAPLPGTPNNSH
jgi:hypothetical protein